MGKENMKIKSMLIIIAVIFLIVTVSTFALLAWVTNVSRVPGTKCLRIPMPGDAVIYTESNSATNIAASVASADIVYLCGD